MVDMLPKDVLILNGVSSYCFVDGQLQEVKRIMYIFR